MGDLVKINDAAVMIGVTVITLRKWEKEGKIKAKRAENGYRLFELSEIERVKNIRDPYLEFIKGSTDEIQVSE